MFFCCLLSYIFYNFIWPEIFHCCYLLNMHVVRLIWRAQHKHTINIYNQLLKIKFYKFIVKVLIIVSKIAFFPPSLYLLRYFWYLQLSNFFQILKSTFFLHDKYAINSLVYSAFTNSKVFREKNSCIVHRLLTLIIYALSLKNLPHISTNCDCIIIVQIPKVLLNGSFLMRKKRSKQQRVSS